MNPENPAAPVPVSTTPATEPVDPKPVVAEQEPAAADTSAEGPQATEVFPSAPQSTVKAHGLPLAVLATLAFVFALQWAAKFLVPVVLGILLAYTLNPLVAWLERMRIPRALGTSIVMLALLGGAGAAGNSLHTEFMSILERLPEATSKISRAVSKSKGSPPGAVQQMQQAASELEKATNQATGVTPPPKRAPETTPAGIRVRDWIWAGSITAVGFVGGATMVLFLVFFLLLSGDTFKRKLVRLTGPSMASKKITVQILEEINVSIQRYMFMLLVTNVLLAVLMWIALRLIGLENAGGWAVVAGFLHIIPYFGPMIITLVTGITAFMQFESISMAALVGGTSLAIATVIGMFVTTWMTGKIAKMNPAAVFISLLFWGWLWGVWGLLLGVPIIVVVKVIAEHVEDMEPIAELLRE
jgi:predicted PurR-regulated permease PerM